MEIHNEMSVVIPLQEVMDGKITVTCNSSVYSFKVNVTSYHDHMTSLGGELDEKFHQYTGDSTGKLPSYLVGGRTPGAAITPVAVATAAPAKPFLIGELLLLHVLP